MINRIINKTTAALLTGVLILTSCETAATTTEITSETEKHGANLISIGDSQSSDTSAPTAEYSEFDLNTEAGSETVYIKLNGDTAEFDSEKVNLKDGVLFITDAGDYELSGNFNSQICVNAGADDNVHLILNGAEISAEMAPLNFVNAKNVSVTLADGSINSVKDSANYTLAEGEDEPNAAIYSKCDLTINGMGELTVYGMYDCGIRSKDDLKIVSGNVTVHSEGDAIKGKDSLVIRDGNITVQTNGDGLKSNNDEDASCGYVIIENGTIYITAADDGIHAETLLQIFGGDIAVNESYEALEGKKIEIYGGNIDLFAEDDGLNAASGNSSVEADDFLHFGRGEKELDFSDIFDGFEGGDAPEMPADGIMPEMPDVMIEAPMGGDRPVGDHGDRFGAPNGGPIPSEPESVPEAGSWGKDDFDDMQGGGNRGGEGMFGGMGGGMNEAPEEGVHILIAGGTIRVRAGVDVIDSNGTFEQTGGLLVTVGTSMTVCGQPDGVVDTNGDAYVNGGTFISLARNSGSVDSFTNVPGFTLSTSGADADEELSIVDASGNTVFAFTPETSSSVIFMTSDLLTIGEEYTIQYDNIDRTFTASENVATIK